MSGLTFEIASSYTFLAAPLLPYIRICNFWRRVCVISF